MVRLYCFHIFSLIKEIHMSGPWNGDHPSGPAQESTRRSACTHCKVLTVRDQLRSYRSGFASSLTLENRTWCLKETHALPAPSPRCSAKAPYSPSCSSSLLPRQSPPHSPVQGLHPHEGAASPWSLSCIVFCHLGFFGCSDSKEPAHHEGDPCWAWIGKMPWRWKWQPTPVFLSGKSHEQRSLVGYSPWGHKSYTQLSDYTHHCSFFWREGGWRWVTLYLARVIFWFFSPSSFFSTLSLEGAF